MPPATPQTVGSFLTRVVAHDGPDVVIVTQWLEPLADGGAPFTLDIDAFTTDGLTLDSQELSGIFERLRELKNRIFFEFLTDEAVELFV
jgi:uncharacterized protein (TIGR04255 family)